MGPGWVKPGRWGFRSHRQLSLLRAGPDQVDMPAGAAGERANAWGPGWCRQRGDETCTRVIHRARFCPSDLLKFAQVFETLGGGGMTVETHSARPCPPSPVADLLDAIEVVRRVVDLTGPDGDPRTCAALLRAAAAVEGLALRQVAAVEAFGTCTDVGKASTADLVQAATGCTVAAARSTVRLAGRLDGDLRPLGDLLVTGRLSRAHCQAVLHGVRGLGGQVIADSIEAISALALLTDPDTLATELRTRAEAISPELAAEARRRLEARIGLSLEQPRTAPGTSAAPCTRRCWRCSKPSPTPWSTATGSRAIPAAPHGVGTTRCWRCCGTPLTAPARHCQPTAATGPRSPSSRPPRP